MKITYKEDIQPILMGAFLGLVLGQAGITVKHWLFWALFVLGMIINASGKTFKEEQSDEK